MKTFHCTACQALVFFENTRCLNCGRALAFSPSRMSMVSVEPDGGDRWIPVDADAAAGESYRLCANYVDHAVCNWSIPHESADTLCRSCALTHTIPDQGSDASHEAWLRLETAKRRLVYALLSLNLPLSSKSQDGIRGLEIQFLTDSVSVNGDRGRVLTGHDNGVITINAAEADDVYRESQRQRQHEPYRTLLGHFRHEIGHYYWDQLIQSSSRLESFRKVFGDEREDYQAALARHYASGAPANWETTHVSAYATTHPWEDWAESWAHVMHMVDALETAQAIGVSVRPPRKDEPALSIPNKPPLARVEDFGTLVNEWAVLTYMLNNLTRGLGLADAYPFVLSPPIVDKLRFVCETMTGNSPS